MLIPIAYKYVPMDFWNNNKIPIIKTRMVDSFVTIDYHAKYYSVTFDQIIFKYKNRASMLRLREAIHVLTGWPIDSRNYTDNISVGFFPSNIAEEIYILYDGKIKFGELFNDDEPINFIDYFTYLNNGPIREQRSPSDKTKGYSEWKLRRQSS